VHRRHQGQHVPGSFSGVSQGKHSKIRMAIRNKKRTSRGPAEGPLVLGPSRFGASKWHHGVDSRDAQLAVQAAHQMADRFNRNMAIQHDLSVVPEAEATKEILEVIRPDWYTTP